MKFVLLVEGDTEARVLPDFFSRWLNPQLSAKVGFKADNLGGVGHFLHGYARKANKYLSSPAANEIFAVVGIVDLFGLEFPASCGTLTEKYDWATRKFEKAVNHPKFRMFFAVHEIEAWILGAPTVLPTDVRNALPKSAANPETVNFNEPPGKLLNRLYRDKLNRRYKKTTDGTNLFRQVDPREAVEKCHYLRRALQSLLDLARGFE
jgi:hypothetical protein